MNAAEKRKMEIEALKQRRIGDVLRSAREVFLERGIDNTRITDIAERAEVGVASVYRYFTNKPEIALAVALDFLEEEVTNLTPPMLSCIAGKNYTGYEKAEKILLNFINIYEDHPEFLKFLEMFDNYVVKEAIPRESLQKYESDIVQLKPLLCDALEQGKHDGSVREDLDVLRFYMTITHSMLSLSQKLLLRGKVLEQDSAIDEDSQLHMLIEMALSYIKS